MKHVVRQNLSIHPKLREQAINRSKDLGLPFSAYIQELIKIDLGLGSIHIANDEEVKQHLGIQEDEDFNRSNRDSKQDAKNKAKVKAMMDRSKEINSQLAGKPSKKEDKETA